MKNIDIRNLMDQKRVHHYEVAAVLGVDRTTFSRWLQKEMTPSKKEVVKSAIEKVLKNE